jgi:transcriptional regulator with XRE-family HTH domain
MSRPKLNPIRERRQERGWNRETLAVRAGLSATTVGWAERIQYLSRETAEKLAQALECEPDDLLPRGGG